MKKVARSIVPAAVSDSPIMRYVLIVALVVLLGFAIVYIVNIQKAAKETFEGGNNYSVVYIFSDSCGYCTKFTPTFAAFKQGAPSNLTVVSYEKSMPAAVPFMSYVSAFPTVLIMNNGTMVDSKSGNMDLVTLQSFVASSTAA